MPGVPSSRGCESCRKRKKKCDLAQPSCARCMRLKIPCVGSGKQRFKFQPAVTTVSTETNFVANTPLSEVQTVSCDVLYGFAEPSRPLYNEVTIGCGSFVSTLVISDPRYDVTNLGGFLEQIPQRLGRNKALDACAKAFAGTMASTRKNKVDVQALTDYGHGLRVLRTYLMDPVMAKMPETLVATFLLTLCQACLGDTDQNYAVHLRGLALLVENATLDEWKDPFHGEVLVAAAFGIVLAGITDPKIKVCPSIIDIANMVYGPTPDPLFSKGLEARSLQLDHLVRFSVYMKEPELHVAEMQSSYSLMILDARRVSKFVNDFLDDQSSEGSDPIPLDAPTSLLKTYFTQEGLNMMLLALVFILNKLLRLADPLDFALHEDAEFISAECLKAARRSLKFKPLGCMVTPLVLGVTWSSSVNVNQKEEASRLLDEFRYDLIGFKFIKLSVQLEERYRIVESRLGRVHGKFLGLDEELGDCGGQCPSSTSGASGASETGCCVM
ncbi:hypothetical protein QQS21_000743 [Conoideocrella luteorostrata]|uniref:Zn(2)-C6 fungal-type domain-containing protein n=1 Tax=Conoideocrella luteorostrata TaxID=1105319 RepID=A0AAJ0FY72_9HYPO|nr:hypothetical protein QQS21_000743 [Conoideocrella luteorostrata]